MGSEALILPILFIGFFAVVAYGLSISGRHRQERLRAQMDLQSRVLERFDSPAELNAFLATEGGRKFLGVLSEPARWLPLRRVLGSIQSGIVLICFGTGFVVIRFLTDLVGWVYPGVVAISLGVGFLVAATVSYRLVKGWGLMPGGRPVTDEPAAV